jgi:hypothetical protein
VADIVPQNERAGFFARRNRLMQAALFVATFAGGWAIQALQLQYSAGIAFAAVFCIAFAARMAGTWFNSRTADLPYEAMLAGEVKFKHLFLLPAYRNELWFLGFVALMGFSVQFASPFFTPYMLNNLRLDVGALGTLTAIAILTKIVAYPYWGRAIDRFRNSSVLMATALLAPFVPLLWLFSGDFWVLCGFQVFSGFVWAGYDLSVFNSALSLVGREMRPSFISKYNIFVALANAAGALAGGAFLAAFPTASVLGFSGILLVFLLSGMMRLAAALVFSPRIAQGRDVLNRHEDRAMVFRLVAVHPTQGAVQQVMNGWDFTRRIVRDGTQTSGEMLREGLEATGNMVRSGSRRLMSRISRRGKL